MTGSFRRAWSEMKGILTFYHSYIHFLETQRHKIASLQLTGKLEDYLVKEFIYHILKNTSKNVFALTNIGNRGQHKIDICILKGKDVEEAVIYGLIEAKYLRNRHRYFDSPATDEVTSSLKELKRQLGRVKAIRHGKFLVKPSGRLRDIYGLVFASYVGGGDRKEPTKRDFYKMITRKASPYFRYYDLKFPQLDNVFDDIKVALFDRVYKVSLRVGLWRKK